MLPSQRAFFDIPRDVCYLNTAACGVLPLKTQEAARVAISRKGQPWTIDPAFAGEEFARARRAAARLVNADPDDIALISSVGYGVATAGKILRVPAGCRVVLLEDDHSSPVLEWLNRSAEQGFTVETVARPADGDWTRAVLEAVERKGAAPVGLASISSVHWSDGGHIDVDRIAPVLRRQGGALLVDATHAVGVMPIDVKTLDPDFLIFPTYKWVVGPYSKAFLYIAKRHQDGVPLEQTSYGRRAVSGERAPYLSDIAFTSGAKRFDMGERDYYISLEMASIGMEMVAEWGAPAIVERLLMLTRRLSEGVADLDGVLVPAERVRAPHILCLGFRSGLPPTLIAQLAEQRAYVAPRLGRVRISPHVYNDEDDIDRFVSVLRSLLR